MKRNVAGISLGLAVGTLAAWAVASGFKPSAESGLTVGDNVFAFEPTHVTGPDKGTNTCPVCKYGMTSAVQVWVTGDSEENVAKVATTLQKKIDKAGTHSLKAFVVYVEKPGQSKEDLAKDLTKLAANNNLKDVALIYVPPTDESVSQYKISSDASVKNTVLVYTKRRVTDKFVNLEANDQGLADLSSAVDKVTK